MKTRERKGYFCCAEGRDNFTDGTIKGLKEHLWGGKRVVPNKKFRLVVGMVLGHSKGFLSRTNFQLAVDILLRIYLHDTASLIN